MQAAHMGDTFDCPLADGTSPHQGGNIISGARSVMIGGQQAASQGDSCVCHSPAPNVIAGGFADVLIEGKPAARQGDKTAHGGKILEGDYSVLIGE